MAVYRFAISRVCTGTGTLPFEPLPGNKRFTGSKTVSGLPIKTVAALAARGPADNHFVTNGHLCNPLTKLHHNPGACVAEHGRERHSHLSIASDLIRVTNSRCNNTHQHFAASGLLEFQFLFYK